MRNDVAAVDVALAEGADPDARVALAAHPDDLVYPAQPALAWAFHLYPERGIPMAERLLAAGANINATDSRGYTPLHRAVLNSRDGDSRFIEFFLTRGADPNTRVHSFYATPLEQARVSGIGIAKLLLQAGARITSAALSNAKSEPEMLALLEEWPIRSSSLRDRDQELMLVARQGDLKRVTRLLREGASATARDAAGDSAFDHALKKGHANVARVLERKAVAALDGAALFEATLGGSEAELAAAARSVGLEQRNAEGLTALMLAARYGRHEAILQLLALGAKLEQRNGHRTALVYAIEASDLEGTVLLLDRGAAIDVVEGGTNPVLEAACTQRDSDLVKLLILRGIDFASHPDQRSAVGESARLLRNARVGKPPIEAPSYSSSATCDLCSELPERMGWCQPVNGDHTGAPLPDVTARFETFETGHLELWKCPGCGAYFEHERDHDNGIPDGWDSESLVRIPLQRALEKLRESAPSARNSREVAAIEARLSAGRSL